MTIPGFGSVPAFKDFPGYAREKRQASRRRAKSSRVIWALEQLMDRCWVPEISYCGDRAERIVRAMLADSSPAARKFRRVRAYVPRGPKRRGTVDR